MGHKVSAIHSVKSENYYEKGNAINEVWVGDVELISRLPFGDSDLAQAAWPVGGWPKIPWHNFIIPLKRRAFSCIGGGDDDRHGGLSKRGMTPIHLSPNNLLIAAIVLSFLFMAAMYLPIALRQHTPPYSWDADIRKRKQQKRRFAIRATIATTSLIVSLVLVVLQFHLWTIIQDVFAAKSVNFMILEALWTALGCVGLYFAVKAVTFLWLDWKDARRATAEDMSDELMEKQLPGIVDSCLERQRRP